MRPELMRIFANGRSENVITPRFVTIDPEHPDLTVGFGQATFDAEGMEESGPYFSRLMHWPGGNSGVTIGRGYDLGSRTRAQVAYELKFIGLSQDDANFFAQAAGLKGTAARDFVASHWEESPLLSLSSQKRLFETITSVEVIADLKRILGKPDLQAQYGAISWEQLSPMAQEIVFDLRYRGDYTPATRERLQPLLVSHNDRALTDLISDKSYWLSKNVPLSRIEHRAALTRRYFDSRMASNAR